MGASMPTIAESLADFTHHKKILGCKKLPVYNSQITDFIIFKARQLEIRNRDLDNNTCV